MKRVFAVVAGVMAGATAIGLIEWLSHKMYPLPGNIDPKDPEALRMLMHNMPLGALLMIILAWAAGAFIAGIITTLIVGQQALRPSLVAGTVLLLFGIINMMMLPHPIWFWILGILVFLPAAFIGHKIVAPKTTTS